MRIYATDHFVLPLPPGHRFPMAKYARLQRRVTDVAADLITVPDAATRALDRARPDLAIYPAGADPYAGDRLGRLALSKAGLARRDAQVFDAMRTRGVPVAVTMAGGYADDVDDIVDIHFATIALALERYAHRRVLEFSEP